MVKSLDGIKKLNSDDIKKYRKIVLNYIGEEDAPEVNQLKSSALSAASSKSVDGINLNTINRINGRGKASPKKSSAKVEFFPNLSDGRAAAKAAEAKSGKIDVEEANRLRQAIKRQEEARRKIKEEEKQFKKNQEQAEQDRKDREEKAKQDKIDQEKARIKQAEIKQAEIEKQKRELVEKKRREQTEAIKREELKKKEIIDKAKREVEARKQVEEAKKLAEKIKLAELEKAEKRKIKENSRLEKIKRQQEIEREKQEASLAKQVAREKKKIRRQKIFRKFKRNFNFKASVFYAIIKRNIIFLISLLIICLSIFYIVFCFAVLRFKADNIFIRKAAQYLPVPAVITSRGIISYSDFKRIQDKSYLALSLGERNKYLTEWEVINNIKKKYGMSGEVSSNYLAIKFVLDKDFNQVGWSRINKINEFLQDQNAIENLSKYADEYSGGIYFNREAAAEKFGPSVFNLTISQTSGIIPRADGYYIIQRIDDKANQIGVNYIFIRAKTLEQYLSEKTAEIKVFILAN